MSKTVRDIALSAKTAARTLAVVGGVARAKAVRLMAERLLAARGAVAQANAADVSAARAAGLAEPMIQLLEITDKIFQYMVDRLRKLVALPDPVGRVLEGFVRPNGLQVRKVSVPIGVIGIIYESRPNVTADAAAVCLKSRNAVILRGGSESLRTNIVLADAMREALEKRGYPWTPCRSFECQAMNPWPDSSAPR